ncbi:MAG: DUF3501 family protein [Nitrospirae bacterium]|nr:DUF3501 family protein [Nitrospirota bacterium]
MQKLTLKDILPLNEYEKVRNDLKKNVIQIKANRRVHLGDIITLVFENRHTISLQIQEMMRVEHIYDEKKIQDEIDIYNALIPEQDELSATLFIEITEEPKIKPELDKLMGLDNGRSVFFEIGSQKVYAKFEEGHSNETKISAVHYVRFEFSPELIQILKTGKEDIFLEIDHPNYKARIKLNHATRQSLANDL